MKKDESKYTEMQRHNDQIYYTGIIIVAVNTITFWLGNYKIAFTFIAFSCVLNLFLSHRAARFHIDYLEANSKIDDLLKELK